MQEFKIAMGKVEKIDLDIAELEIPDFETLASLMCDNCRSEDYCPSYCDTLEKAMTIPIDKIQRKYTETHGDIVKVWNYIRRQMGKL